MKITIFYYFLIVSFALVFNKNIYCEEVKGNYNNAVSTSTAVQEEKVVWPKIFNNAFEVGEKLEFKIRWQFIYVGSASMEINEITEIDGRRAYHVIAKARSAPFFDNFFKVRDINESWMDVESLCTLKFVSNISEGKYKKVETLTLDQINNKFMLVEAGKPGKAGDIFPRARDVLASMYYLRTIDLAVGDEYFIDTHSGDKSWPLRVKVLYEDKIKTEAGKFKCWVVEPTIREDSGIFQSKGKLLVWLTKDQRKIPVLMKSKVAIGHVSAKLEKIR